jgi:hypothetical protein
MIQLVICVIFIYFDLFQYVEKLRTCFINRTYSIYLFRTLGTFGIIIYCMLIIVFYVKIFIFIINAKQRAHICNRIKHEIDLKFSKGLFSSIILFIITYVPFSLIIIIDHNDSLPAAYHLYGFALMRINSCLNPLLYGLTNTLFKKGFYNFYFLLFDKKKYSFSIEVKEKKLLNERILRQEIELKNQLNSLKEEN